MPGPGSARPALQRPAHPPLASHWVIDPELVQLNHGSFGACPAEILDAQQRYRGLIEADPVEFFVERLSPMLDASRRAVAGLINAQPDTVVFVRNATQGVLTGLMHAAHHGLGGPPLGPGDEILAAEHEYPACRHNARAIAERAGATLLTVPLGVPTAPGEALITADVLFDRVMAGVSDATRVCLLSLITSPSGLRLPVERLIPALRERGIETILDAAHGVGCVPIDLDAWQPAVFTSNAHKWLCAPKGAAVLWVRDDLRPAVRPPVLSNKAEHDGSGLDRPRWQVEFDYAGTDDPSPWLAIADAVRYLPEIAGSDWPGIMRANRELAIAGRDALCDRHGLTAPADDDLLGPMAMVPLPPIEDPEQARREWAVPARHEDHLADALRDRFGISVPVIRPMQRDALPPGRRTVRISAQRYNAIAQYEYLAEALAQLLAEPLPIAPPKP